MELYNVFCVCGIILILFSVGESFLKNNNLKKYYVLGFFALTFFATYLPKISIFGLSFSINFFLFLGLFVLFIFKNKNLKELLKILLMSCVSFAFCVCYNSINLLQYEFAYFQPYLVLCVILGVVCCFISLKFSSIFCGLFVGVTISELIRSQDKMFVENIFSLGDLQFVSLIVFTLFVFVVSRQLITLVSKLKQTRKANKTAKQN